jgi:type VI secretion system protein ImpM
LRRGRQPEKGTSRVRHGVSEKLSGSLGDAPDARAGFFGKVTSHGDFVARRLAPSFQQPWDGWVQSGLQQSRQALGERWLPAWLNSPIWRFALAPGVCGEPGWAGVLMPSVDRVGRHFPLTVAAGWDGQVPLFDCVTGYDGWFSRLEELALSSLRDDFSLEAFDAALCALAGQPAGAGVSGAAPEGTVIVLDALAPLPGQLENPSPRLLQAAAAAALRGHSLWWTDGAPHIAPCLLVCRGLPSPEAFTALLDGDWQGHGWGTGA